MGHTNSTANLALPQFIGTDKPTWLSDVNGAFAAIDTYAGNNDAALAITDAKADTAIGDAASAVTTAGNAATTAGNAAATATAANTVAGNALTVANGINSKVGVLTDLTTTDKSTVVNAINEVNGKGAGDIVYDNTGSGLTATNVQDAIDEIAQGGGAGTWTLSGTVTGQVDIAIPATAKEIFIKGIQPNGSCMTKWLPIEVLDATQELYIEGGAIHSTSNWYMGFNVSTTKVTLQTSIENGTGVNATTEVKLYVR